MINFIKSRTASFGFAFRGWWYVIRNEKNAWIHAVVTIFVVVLGTWLVIPPIDWAVLILTIAMVWAAEFLNTSIEAVVDLASPVHHPLARVGKDVGAAAVLISAFASILVGLIILGPPLMARMAPYFIRLLSRGNGT
jgi:diacylglycerol kinase (ATP)